MKFRNKLIVRLKLIYNIDRNGHQLDKRNVRTVVRKSEILGTIFTKKVYIALEYGQFLSMDFTNLFFA